MAEVKNVNMHKRRAMGEAVTGMKKGGATRDSKKAMPFTKKKSGGMAGKKGKC